MSQKKSVDEIWKELNARPAPRPRANGLGGAAAAGNGLGAAAGATGTAASGAAAAAAGSIHIPGLGTVVRRVPPPAKPAVPLAAPDAAMEDVPILRGGPEQQLPIGGAGTHRHASAAAVAYDLSQLGLTSDEVSSYQASIQRLVNCLSDPDRATRRQAATTLQGKLVRGEGGTPAAGPAMLQALACGSLLGPLLGMLSDVVEKCRCEEAPSRGFGVRLGSGWQAPQRPRAWLSCFAYPVRCVQGGGGGAVGAHSGSGA